MTAAAATGAAAFRGRYEALRAELPGAGLPWLAALREAAAAAFAAQGFPTRRLEAWKYTDLAALLGGPGFEAPLSRAEAAPPLPPAAHPRAVLLDGRFRPDLSTLGGLGFAVGSLAAALPRLEGRLGALARPAEHPMAALNGMLFEDGLLVEVPAGLDGGVLEVVSLAGSAGRAAALHPRHLVRLGEGARLALIETIAGPAGRYLHNPVLEIELAQGARLSHGRLQQEGAEALFLSTLYARIAAGATYDNFTLNAGARLARNELHVVLAGPRGAAHMNGVQLAADGQHADTTTALDHAAPDCASRQTYKTVLAGRARGVFQGRIHVHQAAQRTDGYQMNQALLLGAEAEMDSKPQLEIYADDVKCSHGATVGALDEDMLFFLRSRGIPAAAARAMLVEAFVAEAVEAVEEAAIREAAMAAIRACWPRLGMAA